MRLLLLIGLSAGAWAQSIDVYSEFARIGKTGEVIAPEGPREILSPAIVRNGFTSFQIVVHVPGTTNFQLHIGQNPEKAVRVTVYRESGSSLEPVDLPYDAQGTQVFWMDLWTDGNAPVARIKVEPEIFVNNDWVIYPMEGRVMDARVPERQLEQGSASAAELMRTLVCGTKRSPISAPATPSIMSFEFRNAQQDLVLAAQAPKEELKKIFGACDATTPENPEWYLRIRDYLFRLR